jgi:hypothetical protein
MVLRTRSILFLMPIAVLLFTRLGIELSVLLVPMRYAWIPSFVVYYVCIWLCMAYPSTKFIDSGVLWFETRNYLTHKCHFSSS